MWLGEEPYLADMTMTAAVCIASAVRRSTVWGTSARGSMRRCAAASGCRRTGCAAAIKLIVTVEVLRVIWMAAPVGGRTAGRIGTVVAVAWIVIVVDVTAEAARAAEPRASADEDSVHEPCWAVIAIRRTVVRWECVVSVRADRCSSYVDAERHLRL